MDIILEVTDTFLWDYLYAWALPAPPAPLGLGLSNSTTIGNGWEYKPSTTAFSLQPSQAAYQSSLPRDNLYRQGFSLFLIIWLFGLLVYYVFASLSYFLVYDKANMSHPKFLKNQIWLEMLQANQAFPVMSILTVPLALAEVRGYSKLYDTTEEGPGYWYSFAQGFPYHLFAFIFPLQKVAYVLLFVFVNFWTILIHDGEYYADNAVINGAACHAVHHFAFNYNYGQYTTLWDRIGGSYRRPDPELFDKATKTSDAQWEKQKAEMERMVKVVEGKDDRTYDPADKKTQ
ncbi:hypothetical protein RB595_000700 [Gaeumannomyces hyphopodioides]